MLLKEQNNMWLCIRKNLKNQKDNKYEKEKGKIIFGKKDFVRDIKGPDSLSLF